MCTPSRRLASRTFKLASSAGAIAAVLALAGTTWAGEKRNDEVFSLKTVIPIPGNNLVSFDISWVDPVIHKYFLADRNNKSIDVIKHTDTKTPTFDTQIIPPAPHAFAGTPGVPACTGTPGVGPNDCAGPDGVLTLNDTHGRELWVGDGPTDDPSCTPLPPATGFTPCSTVKVFPAGASGAAVPSHTIPTFGHQRSDELCFDPVDHLVMVANNADNPPFASLISTQTYTVVGKIKFNGTNGAPDTSNGIEQCQWSPRTGLFYINVPGVNHPDDGTGVTAVIDPKIGTAPNVGKVVKVFPIPHADCAAPQGMAVGPDPQILLGCNGDFPPGVFNTVIINEHTGHVMATLANEGGNDEVWFNPGDGHYFLARGQNLPDEFLGVVDSQFRSQDQSIQTGTANGTTRRAHSVAADSNSNLVFLPIPATGGGASLTPATVGFQSSICGPLATDQQHGCVAVFETTNDDRPNVARERGPDDNQE